MEALNDASTILELEEEALRVIARSFWGVASFYSSVPSSSKKRVKKLLAQKIVMQAIT